VERPLIEPDVEWHLRHELEQATSGIGDVSPGVVVRVSKKHLRQVLLCERHLVASLAPAPEEPSLDLIAGMLLDRLFGLVVLGHPIDEDPLGEALSAAAVAGDGDLVGAFHSLPVEDQEEVRDRIAVQGRTLAARWPPLPPTALVRLQEPLRAELAGGRVVLSGRVDLALGRPTAERSGTTLVDVKSGKRRYDDALDADWYAVLEALRHRVPPFQSGSYYVRDGGIDLAVYDTGRLARAAARVAEGVARLVRLAAGEAPTMTPNGLCPWCPAFARCEVGRAHAANEGLDAATWVDEDDDDDSA
jgi:hypothetical protein